MGFSVTPKMRARLDEYTGFHQSTGNEICHYLGIPLIIAGSSLLLSRLPLLALGHFRWTLTELVLLPIVAFYLRSARWLGFVTALGMVGLAESARLLPLSVGIAAFVLGWVVQFVGHAVFEHRSPAFFRNFLHLLVGPAWITERVLGRLSPDPRLHEPS